MRSTAADDQDGERVNVRRARHRLRAVGVLGGRIAACVRYSLLGLGARPARL